MDLMGAVFTFYFFGAILVGVYLIREVEFGPDLRIKKKGQKLGPTYWGAYEGANQENPAEQLIVPPEPTKDENGTIGGSGAYSGGKAVKSAR
jgi:hypothetical protein